MSMDGREMVFDRLSRKHTALSVEQEEVVTSVNRSTTHAKSLTPVLPKRSSAARSGMTMDMRMSVLKELELMQQSWLLHGKRDKKNENSGYALLVGSLDNPMPSPPSSSSIIPQKSVTSIISSKKMAHTTVRKELPVVSEPIIQQPSQSVFERLYHQGTKASVGQQVESVRQKNVLERQTNKNKSTLKSSQVSELDISSEKANSAHTAETPLTCPSTADGGDSTDGKSDQVTTSFSNPRSCGPVDSPPAISDVLSCCVTPERTPEMICITFSDNSSASTISSLVELESPPRSTLCFPNESSSIDAPLKDVSLEFSLFSKKWSTIHDPWKMALKRKKKKDGKRTATLAEPLYLRSMSNILYDFAHQDVGEEEVAIELITALFRRDFEYGKYWTEEAAQVVADQDRDGEYVVQKAAESSLIFGGSTPRTLSSAHVKFDYAQRMIMVVDYYHGFSIVQNC
jgi:hypothetical protein